MSARKRNATISIQYARRILEAAKDCFVRIEPLCEAAEIPVPPFPDPDLRISVDQYLRLWGAVMDQVQDPSFPLRVARVVGMAEYGVLGLACKTSATIEEALTRAQRFLPLATDAARWKLLPTRNGVEACLKRGASRRPELRYVDEFVLAELVWTGRMMSNIDWAPVAVSFAHDAPSNLDAFRSFFRAPLHWNREVSKIEFGKDVLKLPLLKADSELSAFFEKLAVQMLEAFPAEEPLLHAVRRTIAGSLGTEAPSISSVATALAMSERTLRRRIADAGTSFRQLLDDVRCEWAKRELGDPRRSREDIASQLGFSDPSAFHRAFRRWTGTTPHEYQRSLVTRR